MPEIPESILLQLAALKSIYRSGTPWLVMNRTASASGKETGRKDPREGTKNKHNIELREATLADRVPLDELFREELEYHVSLMPDMFSTLVTVVDETWLGAILKDDTAFMVVAESREGILGAIFYRIMANPDDPMLRERRFGYIEELVVQELFRGKGIGNELLGYAIEDLKRRDIHDIELDVWENNIPGSRFFERHGFTVMRKRMKRRTDRP